MAEDDQAEEHPDPTQGEDEGGQIAGSFVSPRNGEVIIVRRKKDEDTPTAMRRVMRAHGAL